MLNIPNILTGFRIFLIPIFVVLFYLPVTWAHAAAAFVIYDLNRPQAYGINDAQLLQPAKSALFSKEEISSP